MDIVEEFLELTREVAWLLESDAIVIALYPLVRWA